MATKFDMYILNEMIPYAIKLNPSPQNLKITSDKLFSQTRTLGGWVFEHWGEKPSMLSISGRTKMLDDDPDRRAAVEFAFFTLQKLYKLDKRTLQTLIPGLDIASDFITSITNGLLNPKDYSKLAQTLISWKYDVYTGFFTKFQWQHDAMNPRVYTYSFDFLITATAINYLTDLLFMPDVGAALSAVGGPITSITAF